MTAESTILVVGGGISGSSAALALTHHGRHVELYERSAGPSDKVCGEFISPEAVRMLNALGMDLDRLGARPIDRAVLHLGALQVPFRLPFVARSLSRRRLDEALLERAEMAGVQVHRGRSVHRMDEQPTGGVVCDIGQTDGAQSQTRHVQQVILASGKHEVRGVSRRQDQGFRSAESGYIGLKMTFAMGVEALNRLDGLIRLFFFSDGYAGLQLTEGNRANLCLIVKQEAWARDGNRWDPWFDRLLVALPALRQALGSAQPCWARPLAVACLPYGFVSETRHGAVVRIGDQRAVTHSFTGDGMALALCSALAGAAFFDRDDSRLVDRALRAQVHRAQRLHSVIATLTATHPGLTATCARFLPATLWRAAARATRLDGGAVSKALQSLESQAGRVEAVAWPVSP